MAWKEVETVRRAKQGAAVRVYVTGGGGLHVSVSPSMAEKLGWREGTTLTLLVGSAESAGKIALKPKNQGAIALKLVKVPRTDQKIGKVYVGQFDGLVSTRRASEEPLFEQKNDQLILTLPDDWLKAA